MLVNPRAHNTKYNLENRFDSANDFSFRSEFLAAKVTAFKCKKKLSQQRNVALTTPKKSQWQLFPRSHLFHQSFLTIAIGLRPPGGG